MDNIAESWLINGVWQIVESNINLTFNPCSVYKCVYTRKATPSVTCSNIKALKMTSSFSWKGPFVVVWIMTAVSEKQSWKYRNVVIALQNPIVTRLWWMECKASLTLETAVCILGHIQTDTAAWKKPQPPLSFEYGNCIEATGGKMQMTAAKKGKKMQRSSVKKSWTWSNFCFRMAMCCFDQSEICKCSFLRVYCVTWLSYFLQDPCNKRFNKYSSDNFPV